MERGTRRKHLVTQVTIAIVIYLLISAFQIMPGFSGQEIADIREILLYDEFGYVTTDGMNKISELDITITYYPDGSYLVSNEKKGTLLFNSSSDKFPSEKGVGLIDSCLQNIGYLILVLSVIIMVYLENSSEFLDEIYYSFRDEDEDEDEYRDLDEEDQNIRYFKKRGFNGLKFTADDLEDEDFKCDSEKGEKTELKEEPKKE